MLINLGDVADGVLVSAIGAVGRMLTRPLLSRSVRDEMDVAAWLDTEALTRDGLPGATLEVAGLSQGEGEELRGALESIEVQGALQALLAARLTDAPETEAAKAREAVRAAVAGHPGTAAARRAEQVSGYYDDKICALVGDLQGRVGAAGLSQVRSEAFSSRIVALLGTLTELVAALADPDRGGQAEADFLIRYRRQARYRHGNLEPPDFERRRRVPVGKIYVSTRLSLQGPDGRWFRLDDGPHVLDLAEHLDRTVLLGDPGGGKTTAANVLADYFASDASRKVPFFVTLREYAAKDPPEHSVAEHIEHTLATRYQCPAPDGLVERLLRTGGAVVIFDGLDELLDTSRRRDVSERVEQFCAAYPLTPVLVTSRLVGYDQARLDDSEFICYRLGRFDDDQVADYVRKWFALQDGVAPAEAAAQAAAFLAESANAPDLRSNPLLLSLMCILYRGAGSLPRDRAGIYGKCAELLFGKWDEQRAIRHKLRAADHVESATRYLAWWLFTSHDAQTAVPENDMIDVSARFLHKRAFETQDEARAAAREFVEFCRGRMWVLTDAGTTANGEKLYAFTHRTFLEYFAAAHLSATSDTPEGLARGLAPRLAAAEWEVVGQLAIALKDRASDQGADRIYATLLDPALMEQGRWQLLAFLIRCLESARLAPATARNLTRAVLGGHPDQTLDRAQLDLVTLLLSFSADYEQLIADEISRWIESAVSSDDAEARDDALQLALEAGQLEPGAFWEQWSQEQARRHAAAIAAGVARSASLRTAALRAGIISMEQALAMAGGFGALMSAPRPLLTSLRISRVPYPLDTCRRLLGTAPDAAVEEFAAIGRYLISHPATPWVRTVPYKYVSSLTLDPATLPAGLSRLSDEVATLGFAAAICVNAEMASSHLKEQEDRRSSRAHLRQLPVPAEFRHVFRDWVDGRVDFIEILRE